MSSAITVVFVEPGKVPVVREIDNSLKVMQTLVGGYIETVYPFDDPVALVCNDEGKLQNLPLNRALRDEDKYIYDVIAGPFFICAALPGNDNFTSLTEKQVQVYTEMFKEPEAFMRLDDRILVVPVGE